MTIEENIGKIKEIVFRERKIMNELTSLFSYYDNTSEKDEKEMVKAQIESLKDSMKKNSEELLNILEATSVQKPLEEKAEIKQTKTKSEKSEKKAKVRANATEIKSQTELTALDKEILKRLKKKKEKEVKKKEIKPSVYIKTANNFFAAYVRKFIKQKTLTSFEKELIKGNLPYTSVSYFSMTALTTVLAFAAAFVIFIFLLFFDIGPDLPIITRTTTSFGLRFLETFWLLFVAPIGTFFFMYAYPSLEKKSVEGKINREIPFATIHMAAIAGSMIEPTKIFQIISATGEYPALEREFNKLLNEINIYGYDFVTALRDLASNSPSMKLAELFNGLATTITSGGDLFDFFDKRAQTLLFEYRLDKEKRTKSAETFMDIYISVVIAAPMILMLLLMMMKISGLGIALSTSTITFLVVGAVSLINIIFLVFLQVKQPEAI